MTYISCHLVSNNTVYGTLVFPNETAEHTTESKRRGEAVPGRRNATNVTRNPEPRELLQLLASRSTLLRALTERPRDKRTLAGDLDISRSTVDRAIRELVAAGVVRQQGRAYETTLTGRCALDAFEQCVRSLRGIEEARDLLSMLPLDAPLDPVFFKGATVHTSSPEIPDSVIQRLFTSIEDADRLYGIAPVALAGQLRPFYEAATAGGTTVEMVIADELFEKLLDAPDSRAVIVEQLQRDSVNIYRTEVPFRFGLWAVDDEAGIAVYTDTGIGGLALNDEVAAVGWAMGLFDSLRDEATLVTLSALDEESNDSR